MFGRRKFVLIHPTKERRARKPWLLQRWRFLHEWITGLPNIAPPGSESSKAIYATIKRDGFSHLDMRYDRTNRVATIQLLSADTRVPPLTAARRLGRMMVHAEEKAKKMGARSIVTTWTSTVPPRIAKRFGYRIMSPSAADGLQWRYVKDL